MSTIKLFCPPRRTYYAGIAALLKPGGRAILSVYNEESLIYDIIAFRDGIDAELPIAAVVNLWTGILEVAVHRIPCEAFSISRLERLIRQAGLDVVTDQIRTFPTLHLTLDNIKCNNSEIPGFVVGGDPLFPLGRFNEDLYRQDIVNSKLLKSRGHYIIAPVFKPLNKK